MMDPTDPLVVAFLLVLQGVFCSVVAFRRGRKLGTKEGRRLEQLEDEERAARRAA